MMRRGFTLIELLVVVGIIAILSALLFPVFVSAKRAGERAGCSSNFRQALLAHQLYQNEYDDRFVLSGFKSGNLGTPLNDRKWPQILAPYAKSFAIFQCPADDSSRPSLESLFSADLSLADPEARLYVRAQRTNLGYNAHYLSPRVGFGDASFYNPVSAFQVSQPADTFMFVDSVWEVRNGVPSGGGSFVVQPPCRLATTYAGVEDTIFDSELTDLGEESGWDPSGPADHRSYGGAWPWHGNTMTVGYVDGHVKAMTTQSLAGGCDVRPNLRGNIFSLFEYRWDLR